MVWLVCILIFFGADVAYHKHEQAQPPVEQPSDGR